MDSIKVINIGFFLACLSGLAVGYLSSLMNGFYAFSGVSILAALVLWIMNFEVVKNALDITPMRIASWIVFVISVVIIAVIYAQEFDFPLLPAIFVSILSAGYLFHTWYTLEPQKG